MSAKQSKTSPKKGKVTKMSPAEKIVNAALENAERTTTEVNSLVRSPLNARTTKKHTPEDLFKLAESIMAFGILQNLIVYTMPNGLFGVAAGEGRLGAVESLQESGRIPSNYEIPILIVPEKVARLVSLIENSHRQKMHPTDQISAFTDLISEGRTPQEVAAFMGFPTKHVQKMIKLAEVHPKLLEELAADKIDIDQLQALASTDDIERQFQVWENSEHWYGGRLPKALRNAVLREETPAENNPKLSLVGVKSYEEAGGVIRQDLFSECGFISDPILLDTLALNILNNAAKEIADRDGWQWGIGRFTEISRWGSDEVDYRLLTKNRVELSNLEEETQNKLEYQLSVLNNSYEEMTDSDEIWETEKKIEDKEQEIELFHTSINKRSTWTEEQRMQSGVVAYLNNGKVAYQFGVVLRDKINKTDDLGDSLNKTSNLEHQDENRALSSKLICSLSSERTLAVQAALSTRPDIVIAALLHDSIKVVFGKGYICNNYLNVSVSVNRSRLIQNTYNADSSKAVTFLNESHEKWLTYFPENWENDFDWLLEWTLEKQLALLAYCMAGSVNGVQHITGTDGSIGGELQRIESKIDFDLSKWWQPTKDNFFAHMSKGQISAILNASGVTSFSSEIIKMKKKEVSELAEKEIAKTDWFPSFLITK